MIAQEERTFPAEPAAVPAVRHWVTALAEEATFTEVVPDLALAVTEAVSNVVRHSGSESLTVVWRTEDDRAVVEVSDLGVYDEKVAYPHKVGGLGLPVMTAVMDEVSILRAPGGRQGTRVHLVKRKP